MVQFNVKLAHQIMFWFNQLMGSGLVLFQVGDFWVAIISVTISH